MNDFVDFQVYRVNDTIVDRYSNVVFADNKENLVRRLDTRSQGLEWVLEYRWVNETNTDNTYTITTEEGLRIREGQETELKFGVSAAFKGLGVSIRGALKTFTSCETSNVTTADKFIVAEARKTTYFYQKQYNFLQEVWFLAKGSDMGYCQPFQHRGRCDLQYRQKNCNRQFDRSPTSPRKQKTS